MTLVTKGNRTGHLRCYSEEVMQPQSEPGYFLDWVLQRLDSIDKKNILREKNHQPSIKVPPPTEREHVAVAGR